ncbi:MAG: hypothetical protein ABI977_32545 [Acidobacteriota bacterium]
MSNTGKVKKKNPARHWYYQMPTKMQDYAKDLERCADDNRQASLILAPGDIQILRKWKGKGIVTFSTRKLSLYQVGVTVNLPPIK